MTSRDHNPIFTARDVSRATGVNPQTIRTWRAKGYLELSPAEGWHRYELVEILQIAVFADLLRLYHHEVAAPLARACLPEFGRMLRGDYGDRSPFLVAPVDSDRGPILQVHIGADAALQALAEAIGRSGSGAIVFYDLAAPLARVLEALFPEARP